MPTTSQLDAAPPLPLDLSQVEHAPDVPAASTMGQYTAARFFRDRPTTYQQIARAQAEGASDRQITRIFGVHHEIARAIRMREAGSQTDADYRRTITASLRGGVVAIVDELADRLQSSPSAVSTRDLVSALRELNGAERVHAGAPSSIVGVIRAEGATAMLEELLRQAADARGIGLEAEKAVPREAGRDVAGLLGEASSSASIPSSSIAEDAQAIEISTEHPEADSRLESSKAVQEPADDGAAGRVVERRAESEAERAHGGGGGSRDQGGPFQVDR